MSVCIFYMGHLFLLKLYVYSTLLYCTVFVRCFTIGNLTIGAEVPIFCEFVNEKYNRTPISKNDEKLELSFLFECINPNLIIRKKFLYQWKAKTMKKMMELFKNL